MTVAGLTGCIHTDLLYALSLTHNTIIVHHKMQEHLSETDKAVE